MTKPVVDVDTDQSEDTNFGKFDVKLTQIPDEPETPVTAYKTEAENQRFCGPVSEEEMKVLGRQENVNTKNNTAWAFGVFETWREHRKQNGAEMVPEFINLTEDQMNRYLSCFVMEARKQDGTPYPPRSLYLIICGLLRHLRDYDVNDNNFLDSKNEVFCGFRKVLDAKMKELLSNGYGTKTKQAQPLMPEDREKLWQNNVFESDTAESLQATMFFYSCKLFGLRGHDEHHDLKCHQFSVGTDQYGKFVEFTGRNTKTYKGRLKDREISNKRIRHYSKEGDRCIVDYFELYLQALQSGPFYRRPLIVTPIRYGKQVVDVNKLKNMMEVICARGGLEGNYTNHSGKHTCATQLYMAGVDATGNYAKNWTSFRKKYAEIQICQPSNFRKRSFVF